MTVAAGKIKRKPRELKKKRAGDYIDNEKFLLEISLYRKQYLKYKAEGSNSLPPRMSEYLGLCFYKIAENLAKTRSFFGYPYKEDMVADGYTDCIRYAHVFDPEKGNNPFAYFTQVCWFAFIRKIQKEKKQFYTICKAIENSEIFGLLNDHQGGDEANDITDIGGYTKESRVHMAKFIEDFESAREKKSQKKVSKDVAEELEIDDKDLVNDLPDDDLQVESMIDE